MGRGTAWLAVVAAFALAGCDMSMGISGPPEDDGSDNVTPTEQRSGVASRYATIATVRAGAILLDRVAPELVQGYMRYYLASTAQRLPTGDARAAFAAAFPLPEAMITAMREQIETVLGGI